MSSLKDFLNRKIAARKDEGLLRKLSTPDNLVDFTSNDYLGLARSEALFDLIQKKTISLSGKFNGSTGSRLLSGNSSYAEEIEQKLAQIFKGECALIFNSGYAANQAVLSSLPQKGDCILYDELSHACIKDGARLSLATRYTFKHNDLNDLEKKLQRIKAKRIYIAAESVYSMDGDECPLQDLTQLAEKHNASIILDEAHTTGVIGENGNGLAISLGLEKKTDIRVYTFGKAMGIHGACIVGSTELIQYLINFARPFIYTTALPPHSIASIDCAFDYLKEHTSLQTLLKNKINFFLKHVNFTNRTESKSAIQTVCFPGNIKVREVAGILQRKGFDVRPILSPTVPKGSERLRICLHTFNTDEDIQRLAEAIMLC